MAGTPQGAATGKAAFEMYISGIDKLVENLSHYQDKLVAAIEEAAGVGQALVVNSARSIVPVRTGALQNSIGPGRLEITDKAVRAEVVAAMVYATYVEKKKPYLGPALMLNEAGFRRAIAHAVRNVKAGS